MHKALLLASVLASFAFGCSSSDAPATNNPAGDGGSTSTSNEGGAPSPTGDISGTWDIVGARAGMTPESGTIVLSKNEFTFTIENSKLSYVATVGSMTVTYREDSAIHTIPTTHTPPTSAAKLGILPIDLHGNYTFTSSTDPSDSCTFDGALDKFTGSCAQGGNREPVDRAHAGVVYTATRVQPLDSSFGDLGGEWHASAGASFDATSDCVFTFKGSTIRSQCGRGSGWLYGAAELTFADSGNASGKNDDGVEYSAKRR